MYFVTHPLDGERMLDYHKRRTTQVKGKRSVRATHAVGLSPGSCGGELSKRSTMRKRSCGIGLKSPDLMVRLKAAATLLALGPAARRRGWGRGRAGLSSSPPEAVTLQWLDS